MSKFINLRAGFVSVCLALCLGCSKSDIINPADKDVYLSKASEVFYNDAAAAALVASYASHDSLWHNSLTLPQALELKITEEQYTATITRMEQINTSLRKAYSEGKEVVFAERDAVSSYVVDGDEGIRSIVYLDYFTPRVSTMFTAGTSCVRGSVSCYPPDHFGITWDNVYFTGQSGSFMNICGGHYSSDIGGRYGWSVVIYSSEFRTHDDYVRITVVGPN